MLFDSESLRRSRMQLRITVAGLGVLAAAVAATACVLGLVADGLSRSGM